MKKPGFVFPLLPYDAILPVYDPEFAPAGDAHLLDDELGGLPILVTW